MKIRSKKKQSSDEGQNTEARPEPFNKRENKLTRPDRHHPDDLEVSSDYSDRGRRVEGTRKRSEATVGMNCCSRERLGWRPRAIVGERNNPL